MIAIRTFDKWIADTEKMDSGKGKKIWLTNPNNMKTSGWFKYVKVTNSKSNPNETIYTYENVSEKIAELIAKEIRLYNAKIEIGTYNGSIGCLSYNILKNNQSMSEGIAYISKRYPFYDGIHEKDMKSNKYYSLELILNSLNNQQLKIDFFKIMIFDFIIGNSDRHSNNWAIIKNKNNEEHFAPLYDNGSSLCALIAEDEIDNFLGDDKLRFNALVDSKSKTLIRIDSSVKKIPSHKDVLMYLHANHYNDTAPFVKFVIQKLTEETISKILRSISKYTSYKRRELLKKYLMAKIEILKDIYK